MPGGADTRRRRGRISRPMRRSKLAHEFYASVLDAAERIELDAASEVEGLDGEIALLRMRLRKALGARPDDLALMLRGIDLLVKAVSARYRLSPEAGENLGENMAALVQNLGGLLPQEAGSREQSP